MAAVTNQHSGVCAADLPEPPRTEEDDAVRPSSMGGLGIGRARALVLPGAVAAVLTFGYTPLLMGRVVFSRDMGRLYFAVHQYFFERLGALELPLWFPHEALGVPFVASAVTAVFHPMTLLSALLGPTRGIWAGHIIGVSLAVIGAYLLALRLGTGRGGAATAGITFGCSGPIISMLDNQPFFLGPIAFPWLLLGVLAAVSTLGNKMSRTQRSAALPAWGPGLALAGLALAWAVLAGEMQGAMVMGLGALVLGLLAAEDGNRTRAFVVIAGVGLLGASLAAIQLIPTLAIAPEIDRTAGLDWALAREWSLHPARLSEIFLGHTASFSEPELRYWLYPHRGESWHFSLYCGVAALLGLVLGIPGALDRTFRGRCLLALMIVLVICIWLSLGRWAGLYRLTFEIVPFWNGFRYPEKLISYATLPLSVLAGFAVNRALAAPKRGALAAGALAGSLIATTLVIMVARVILEPGPQSTYLALVSSGLLRGALLALGIAAILALAHLRFQRGSSLPAGLLCVLVLFDMAGPAGRLLDRTTADSVVLTAPSLLGSWLIEERGLGGLGKDRITAVVGRGLAPALPGQTLQVDDDLFSADYMLRTVLWLRNSLEAGHAASLNLESTTHYLPALSSRHADLQVDNFVGWARRGAQLFSGRYLIVNTAILSPSDFPEHEVIIGLPDQHLVLMENPAALARSFLAEPYFVHDPEQARAALLQSEVAQGSVAVVEAERSIPQGLGAPEGSTRIVRYHPERVEVVAELDRPGVLVLNDSWWPGWRATVNEAPADLLRANYLVRGVLLDEGIHEVVFEYRPPLGVLPGALVSLLAFICCLALSLPLLHRSRSGDTLAR